jgi:hypothetical protein
MQILKKKMKEYFHRTHMPPLLAKVNRGITPEYHVLSEKEILEFINRTYCSFSLLQDNTFLNGIIPIIKQLT